MNFCQVKLSEVLSREVMSSLVKGDYERSCQEMSSSVKESLSSFVKGCYLNFCQGKLYQALSREVR